MSSPKRSPLRARALLLGVTTHLSPNLETARSAGARGIALAPSGSPIARLAEVTVAVKPYRQKKTPQPLSDGRVAMFIMLDVIVRLPGERLKGRSFSRRCPQSVTAAHIQRNYRAELQDRPRRR